MRKWAKRWMVRLQKRTEGHPITNRQAPQASGVDPFFGSCPTYNTLHTAHCTQTAEHGIQQTMYMRMQPLPERRSHLCVVQTKPPKVTIQFETLPSSRSGLVLSLFSPFLPTSHLPFTFASSFSLFSLHVLPLMFLLSTCEQNIFMASFAFSLILTRSPGQT